MHLAFAAQVALEEYQGGVEIAQIAKDFAVIGYVAVEFEELFRLVENRLRFEEDGARLIEV